uniref:Gag-Pol polyprotein n=1 Tax=Tanacetum cinerariifolium TaxID=118510 RepID=A0A699GGG9_TANCI|nr:Gag-Pol polyprotein [Tanacetum cinerariifolium]
MIPELGDQNQEVLVNENFHEQTDDELTEKELKQYNQKEVDDLRAERLAKTHDPLALMANSKNPFNYLAFLHDQPSSSTYTKQPLPNSNNYNPPPSFNQNYMQQPMPNPKDITDPTIAMSIGLGHLARNCTVRPRRRDAAYLQTQLLIAQKEEAGIQFQAKEFDLMAAAVDLDEIEKVNANSILMAN